MKQLFYHIFFKNGKEWLLMLVVLTLMTIFPFSILPLIQNATAGTATKSVVIYEASLEKDSQALVETWMRESVNMSLEDQGALILQKQQQFQEEEENGSYDEFSHQVLLKAIAVYQTVYDRISLIEKTKDFLAGKTETIPLYEITQCQYNHPEQILKMPELKLMNPKPCDRYLDAQAYCILLCAGVMIGGLLWGDFYRCHMDNLEATGVFAFRNGLVRHLVGIVVMIGISVVVVLIQIDFSGLGSQWEWWDSSIRISDTLFHSQSLLTIREMLFLQWGIQFANMLLWYEITCVLMKMKRNVIGGYCYTIGLILVTYVFGRMLKTLGLGALWPIGIYNLSSIILGNVWLGEHVSLLHIGLGILLILTALLFCHLLSDHIKGGRTNL